MSERMELARAAWGHKIPDWVAAMIKACDQSSQAKVGSKIGRSGAVVSQIIRNCYPARMDAIEERVRAVFLDGSVDCPALGPIQAETCLTWRDRAKALTSASPSHVRMFRACKTCPRNQSNTGEDE